MGQNGEGWNAPGGRGEGVMSAPRTGMDKAIRPIRVQMRTLVWPQWYWRPSPGFAARTRKLGWQGFIFSGQSSS